MPSYPRYATRSRLSRRKPYMPKKRVSSASWYNKKYSTVDIAQKAYSMAKYLKSLINVEKQKIDFNLGASAIGTTPVIAHMTAIPVGDAEGSRTGNSVLLKYLYMKMTVRLDITSAYNRLRVVVVRDKQQIADNPPTYTDVYETTSTTSLLNKNTVGRFDILFDRNFDIDANNPQILLDQYVSLNSHARYNGTASSDIQKGGIWLMLVSDAASAQPTLSYNNRVMYIDN